MTAARLAGLPSDLSAERCRRMAAAHQGPENALRGARPAATFPGVSKASRGRERAAEPTSACRRGSDTIPQRLDAEFIGPESSGVFSAP